MIPYHHLPNLLIHFQIHFRRHCLLNNPLLQSSNYHIIQSCSIGYFNSTRNNFPISNVVYLIDNRRCDQSGYNAIARDDGVSLQVYELVNSLSAICSSQINSVQTPWCICIRGFWIVVVQHISTKRDFGIPFIIHILRDRLRVDIRQCIICPIHRWDIIKNHRKRSTVYTKEADLIRLKPDVIVNFKQHWIQSWRHTIHLSRLITLILKSTFRKQIEKSIYYRTFSRGLSQITV